VCGEIVRVYDVEVAEYIGMFYVDVVGAVVVY